MPARMEEWKCRKLADTTAVLAARTAKAVICTKNSGKEAL